MTVRRPAYMRTWAGDTFPTLPRRAASQHSLGMQARVSGYGIRNDCSNKKKQRFSVANQ